MTFLHYKFHTAWQSTLSYIRLHGFVDKTRQGGETKRALGYAFRLMDPSQNVLISEERKFSLRYGCGEFCWYLSPAADLEQIRFYAPSYSRFAQDDYGFYGRRLWPEGRCTLDTIVQELSSERNSRRAVIALWNKDDLFETHRMDIPCTLTWQFLVEGDKLNMISTMRSNDAWLGMPNDVFVNTCLQILVCKLAGFKLGWYQHQVGDIHLYDKHWELANRVAYGSSIAVTGQTKHTLDVVSMRDVEDMLQQERKFRMGQDVEMDHDDPFINFILKGIVDADNRRAGSGRKNNVGEKIS